MHCQTQPGYITKIREIHESKASRHTYSAVNVEYVSTDRFEKYRSLLRNYDDEKSLFVDMLSQLPSADPRIKETINTISTWDFANASLEITGDFNAVFKIHLESPKTLYIGINLAEEDRNKDAYFAYYEFDRCERNGVGAFTDIVADLATLKIL
jgi:hypothetical protein